MTRQPSPSQPNQTNRTLYQQGPISIEGVEARDLPDKGRGAPETSPGKELRRKVPNRTGGVLGGDIGIAGSHEINDVRSHGHRKHS